MLEGEKFSGREPPTDVKRPDEEFFQRRSNVNTTQNGSGTSPWWIPEAKGLQSLQPKIWLLAEHPAVLERTQILKVHTCSSVHGCTQTGQHTINNARFLPPACLQRVHVPEGILLTCTVTDLQKAHVHPQNLRRWKQNRTISCHNRK